ncbi:MAG: fimbrillin family protein, partial [Muribaculaceae bacterium]|nr:fimbrillin family protein [Muribaculaceae bacterium]
MKKIAKTTYMTFASVLMLSSCAHEEMPADVNNGSDRRIVFHSSLPELTTRATGIVSDLQEFQISVLDFDDISIPDGIYKENLTIEKDNAGDKYLSNDLTWPKAGKEDDNLHFFAFYPALYPPLNDPDSLVNVSNEDEDAEAVRYQVKSYQIAEDITEQVDFVTAYATGTMTENMFSGISLKFRHQLSRIEVKAKGAHKSCDIQIAGVRIANAYMVGDYVFPTSVDANGVWNVTAKKTAEYIFHDGDPLVKVGPDAVSIMGRKIDDDTDNCAMLIPSSYNGWDCSGDPGNENEGMYLSVLLRVLDKTSKDKKQQYPYYDNSQGLNAMEIDVVYLEVDKTDETVTGRVYKSGDSYFSDENCTESYT